MIDFVFQNPTKVIFGKDALSHLGEEVRRYGTKVLMIYGGGSIRRLGLYDRVKQSLADAGATAWELPGVQPNPRLSLIREGIKLCKENGIQLVLAIGGGSAIDTGKAVANGTCYDGDVWDLFTGKGKNTEVLPLGTIVTIPAAGSEMSDSCVITREEDSCKRGRNTPLNFPKFSILNPEYTFTLPPFQTACGIVDIMSHMMERYFTKVEHVELIDRMTEGALTTVINNAPLVMAHPEDYDARAEIMWAGCLAHNTLFQTGRVGDWACHKLEHELSALYDIAHGAGLAIVTPAWMKYVLPRGGAKKFAQFAVRVMDVSPDFGTEDETAAEGIRRLETFYHSLGLPTTLGAIDLTDRDFPRMAERCTAMLGGTIGNLCKLDQADALEIYKLAL